MKIHKINGEEIAPRELREVFAQVEDAKYISDVQKAIQGISKLDENNEPVFAVDSPEFISSIIKSKRGATVLYYDGAELVGFFELTCPDNPIELEEEYNVSNYLPNIDINNTGVAESFVVLPKYRGNNLQVEMFKRMEEIAKEKGITSLIGTVHPENSVSANNFKKAGYNTVTRFKVYYGERLFEYKSVDTKYKEGLDQAKTR